MNFRVSVRVEYFLVILYAHAHQATGDAGGSDVALAVLDAAHPRLGVDTLGDAFVFHIIDVNVSFFCGDGDALFEATGLKFVDIVLGILLPVLEVQDAETPNQNCFVVQGIHF